ncbi:hypothetical protein P280DRAFT_521198 [Massarina eburnea CBS 473.64]|uniref:Uncharacterized protein n=1 Tax=Massarina eburnea CBS 473.64 TaxID=1395130 RepID=A0A6A6RU28_9PLEO|nr:hypothetical protein P280DRAFT_521198 [Massarina eburnea CBS 473.64]
MASARSARPTCPTPSLTLTSESSYDDFNQLAIGTQVPAEILQKDTSLEFWKDTIELDNNPTRIQLSSYAAQALSEYRAATRRRGSFLVECFREDFNSWQVPQFNKVSRTIRQELLILLQERGIYPYNEDSDTQSNQLYGITQGRYKRGLQQAPRTKEQLAQRLAPATVTVSVQVPAQVPVRTEALPSLARTEPPPPLSSAREPPSPPPSSAREAPPPSSAREPPPPPPPLSGLLLEPAPLRTQLSCLQSLPTYPRTITCTKFAQGIGRRKDTYTGKAYGSRTKFKEERLERLTPPLYWKRRTNKPPAPLSSPSIERTLVRSLNDRFSSPSIERTLVRSLNDRSSPPSIERSSNDRSSPPPLC